MTKPTFAVKPGAVALMALMAATRFNHFGTPFALPDASLAIFFFAGLWLGGRYLFALLLLEAGLIDYLAISKLGVSDYCISAAYGFLIASYGAMWLGGKWCRKFSALSISTSLQQLLALTTSTSIAFLISNGSFFLLSDKVSDHSWAHYVQSVANYYPAYLTTTLIYGVAIFGMVQVVKAMLGNDVRREAV
jgi:hypothetical protein